MSIKKNYVRPLDIKHGRIDMNHGAGGHSTEVALTARQDRDSKRFHRSYDQSIDGRSYITREK